MESHQSTNPIQATLEDLTRATTSLQADLATVMGPSDEDGQLGQQQIESHLATLGAPPAKNAGAAIKKAYLDKLTAAVQETINAETKQAREKATQALNTKAKEVEKAVTSTKQAMDSAVHHTPVNADQQREKAISTFNDS